MNQSHESRNQREEMANNQSIANGEKNCEHADFEIGNNSLEMCYAVASVVINMFELTQTIGNENKTRELHHNFWRFSTNNQ